MGLEPLKSQGGPLMLNLPNLTTTCLSRKRRTLLTSNSFFFFDDAYFFNSVFTWFNLVMAKLNLTCIAEGKSMTCSLKNCFLHIFPIYEIEGQYWIWKTKGNQYLLFNFILALSRYMIAVLRVLQYNTKTKFHCCTFEILRKNDELI